MLPIRSFALGASLFFGLAAGASCAATHTTAAAGKEVFPEASVRADFKHLYDTLEVAHFDLCVYRSCEAYARYYREVLGSIDGPMGHLEVVRKFTPFVAFGNIGHTRIDFPVQDYIEYLQAGGTLLPLDIRVEGAHVYIAYNYSGDSRLAPGTEIVALDGRSIAWWIERTSRYVSGERPYMVHAQLESMFPRLVWLEAGKIDSFRVALRSHPGSDTVVSVDAVPVMAVEEQKGKLEAAHNERKAEILSNGIAYLRPGPFYATSEHETLETFVSFIDDAFRRFMASDAQDLIIDLRDNPGGDNSFSDPMLAWIADKPFRFASRYELKASAQTRQALNKLAAKEPGGISARMLASMKKYADGETFAFEIPGVEPRKSTFPGRVWAVVNRHSYSNATAVAAIIQDHGFGTILGEETSDVPTSYASSAQFTLPETGIVVTYPKAYFVRPNGDEMLRGVVPDRSFTSPIAAGDEDVVLEDVRAFVLSQRSGSET